MKSLYASAFAHAVMITAIIALSTVALHEFGHFAIGSALGCENVEIKLLSADMDTYTQMTCPRELGFAENSILLVSGSVFVLPIALGMLLLRNYERYYSLVIIGLNLVMSSFDFYLLSAFIPYATILAGAAMIIYGEHLVTDRYVQQIEKIEKFALP